MSAQHRPGIADVIRARNDAGHIAIGIYLIPGFPDWPTSDRAADIAIRLGVDFAEYPVLTGPGWSGRTGPVIANALTQCLDVLPDRSQWISWLNHWPTRVGVVYELAWDSPDAWRAPLWMRAGAAGLLIEAATARIAEYSAAALEFGTPLIATIDARGGALSPAEIRSLQTGGGFIYAALGSRTGSFTGVDPGKISLVRQIRPDLPVCCAFGIDAAAQIRELRTTTHCDGVIIGTSAIQRLRDDLGEFTEWLSGIVEAAHQPENGDVACMPSY